MTFNYKIFLLADFMVHFRDSINFFIPSNFGKIDIFIQFFFWLNFTFWAEIVLLTRDSRTYKQSGEYVVWNEISTQMHEHCTINLHFFRSFFILFLNFYTLNLLHSDQYIPWQLYMIDKMLQNHMKLLKNCCCFFWGCS